MGMIKFIGKTMVDFMASGILSSERTCPNAFWALPKAMLCLGYRACKVSDSVN